MQTKLTVRVNEHLIKTAKLYAKEQGVSLSQLIENYLRTLASSQDVPYTSTPVLDRLSGILPSEVSTEEQKQRWVEKYG